MFQEFWLLSAVGSYVFRPLLNQIARFERLECNQMPPWCLQMKNLYSWMDVAKRTEVVYDNALSSDDDDLLLRLSR